MAWKINEPVELEADSNIGTRPKASYHLITHNNYDVSAPFNATLFWQQMERFTTEIVTLLKGIGIYRISGAPAIDWHTRQATRWHTNFDLALLRQKEPFVEMVKRFAQHGWYSFERRKHLGIIPHTMKIAPHQKLILLEFVHPLEELAIMKPDRNLVFIKRTEEGRLLYDDSLEHRINGYLHHLKGDMLVSSEDGFTCTPQEFQGTSIRLKSGIEIPLIGEDYLKRRKIRTINAKTYAPDSKHYQDMLKLP